MGSRSSRQHPQRLPNAGIQHIRLSRNEDIHQVEAESARLPRRTRTSLPSGHASSLRIPPQIPPQEGEEVISTSGFFQAFKGYRMRAFAFAAVGILLNAYGATHGRREWVVKYDGSFFQTASAKLFKPAVTLSLGFGAPNAVLYGVTCLVLLLGVTFGRPLLCLPSLLISVCEMCGDVSDAVVASGLLLVHLGAVPAALYSAVAMIVIALELFLWHGVLMFYESAIMERIRSSPQTLGPTLNQTPSIQVTTTRNLK